MYMCIHNILVFVIGLSSNQPSKRLALARRQPSSHNSTMPGYHPSVMSSTRLNLDPRLTRKIGVCGLQEGEDEEGESGEEGAAPGGSDAEDGTKYVHPSSLFLDGRVIGVFSSLWTTCCLCTHSAVCSFCVCVSCLLIICCSVFCVCCVPRRRLKRIRRDAAVVEEVRHHNHTTDRSIPFLFTASFSCYLKGMFPRSLFPSTSTPIS